MSWLRLDDKMGRHPKIVKLSDGAFRLHIHALLYCAEQLTDGRVPIEMLASFTRARFKAGLIRELTDSGLWVRVGGEYDIHDYLDWNPSREEVLHKQAVRAAAGARGGKQSGTVRRSKVKANAEANASHFGSPAGEPRTRTQPAERERDLTREAAAIATELRKHPVFELLDVPQLAEMLEGRRMASGNKLEWVLQAIGRAAADCTATATPIDRVVVKLRVYCDNSRPREPKPAQLRAAPQTTQELPDDRATREHADRERERVLADRRAKAGGG